MKQIGVASFAPSAIKYGAEKTKPMYTEIKTDKKEISPAILFKTVGKPQNASYKTGALVDLPEIEYIEGSNPFEIKMRLRRPSGKGCHQEIRLHHLSGIDCSQKIELCRQGGKGCRQGIEFCRSSGRDCRQGIELCRLSGKDCRPEMELCRPSRKSQISVEKKLE